MTTNAFPMLTAAEQIFYDVVWTPMLTAGESWIEVELPFLALPIVKQIDEAALKAVTDGIFNALVELIDVAAIKWKIAANESAYTVASLQLLIIAQESGINSDAYKKARDVAKAALAQFTRLPGS